MDLSKRFEIHQQLGEGSFSKIYQAFDRKLKLQVALKVEKEDKHKKILKFEYEILKHLQGLPHVPKLYDFIQNINKIITFNDSEGNLNAQGNLNNPNNGNGNKNCPTPQPASSEGLNFIVMELLGKNVANYKKSKHNWEPVNAYDVLLQMLDAIEQLHDRGYIHRDVKPTNFVVREGPCTKGRQKTSSVHVYMVDYGLAKVHLDRFSRPLPPRTNTDFRGTLTYASLNAHYKKELSRRDDLWSFFFVILDLLNENLPWRTCKDDKDDIKKVKEICLAEPEKKLLLSTTKGRKEILDILNHIKSLNYGDRPNYFLIKTKLTDLKLTEFNKINSRFSSISTSSSSNINPIPSAVSNLNPVPTANKNANSNNQNILNDFNLSNLNFGAINPFALNNNSNCILYDFPLQNEEYESPTKDNFFINNFLLNNAIGANQGGANNNLNESNNFQRTNSNFTNTVNYFNYPENIPPLASNPVPSTPTSNNINNTLNNDNLNNYGNNSTSNNNFSANLNNLQAQLINSLNSLNSGLNFNIAQYLYNPTNYLELTKKLYLENLMNINLPGNSLFNANTNTNANNFYENFLGVGNLSNLTNFNLGNALNNLNNLNTMSSMNNFNNLGNFGAYNNFNTLNELANLSSLPIGQGFNNLFAQNQPASTQQAFPHFEENQKEDNNALLNKKRKREGDENAATDGANKAISNMTSQQQNQIFIINQFNKSQLTELEKKLLDYLLKQSNNSTHSKENVNNVANNLSKPTNSNTHTNKNTEKDNDKMLINSIINKLKPSEKKPPQQQSQGDLLNNINNLINKINSSELNQLLANVIVKSGGVNKPSSVNSGLDINASSNLMTNIQNINQREVNPLNSKIFKIEKAKKNK